MVEVSESDIVWSHEKIVEAATTWANFNGFTGAFCGQCGKAANVLAGKGGWFCVCDGYNMLDFKYFRVAHANPDLGPTKATIEEALAEVCASKG